MDYPRLLLDWEVKKLSPFARDRFDVNSSGETRRDNDTKIFVQLLTSFIGEPFRGGSRIVFGEHHT